MAPTTPTRRERLRASTFDEIQAVARRLLVTEGPTGVTLRAISRSMGMSPTALYRYYDSLDELLGGLCVTCYDECRGYLEGAADRASDRDPVERIFAACRAFRRWSVEHPAEFELMFGSVPAVPQGSAPHHDAAHAAGLRFAETFYRMFIALWRGVPLRVSADATIPPELNEQFLAFLSDRGVSLPTGVVLKFISCWIRLYGMVALEVFGHLDFTLSNCEPMFETELAAIARDLGLPSAVPERAMSVPTLDPDVASE